MIVKELKKSFPPRELFSNVSFHLRAGDRVALIGPNGVGKSTLFKCLTGEMTPDGGVIRLGANVDMGYYDQHQARLHPEKTVLDEVWDDFPRMQQSQVRGALGMFLFTGDEVFMPISTLSGGEKGRVALTKLMLRQDNLLLLDEPTNHLDMDSREVLEQALADYPGTILAISHDRYFINRFATRVMVLGENGAAEYLGNYDDYIEKVNRAQEPDGSQPQRTRTEMEKEKKRSREEKERIKRAKERVQAAEKAVSDNEEKISALEAVMAAPETYQDPAKAAEAAKAYQLAQEEQARLYEQWEEAEEQLHALTR